MRRLGASATSTCRSPSDCGNRCRERVVGGYGVSFISRTAVEADLASGAIAEARVEGMDGGSGSGSRRPRAGLPRGRLTEFDDSRAIASRGSHRQIRSEALEDIGGAR